MLICIPCPNTRGLIKVITKQIKGVSLKAVGVQRRKKQQHPKETAIMETGGGGGEEIEWIAEPEPGVLITLVALTNGANRLKKIRFSEELFDAWGAQRWWADNYDKIMELYSIHQEPQPRPLQSDDEYPNESVQAHKSGESSPTTGDSVDSHREPGGNHSNNAPIGEGSTTIGEEVNDSKAEEWVVEEEKGVCLTIRSLPDGSKELLRVELSRERFGEVKARVWWEENKARLHMQYSW